MAEINTLQYKKDLFLSFFLPILILCIPCKVLSQDIPSNKKGTKIEILYSDIWEANEKIEKDLQRLIGNVRIKHKDVYMTCDSAYYYKEKNQVKAYSKVHIEQGDTIDLYGDYLFYDGESENATVTGKVELVDKETHLYTDAVDYDVKNRVAKYVDKGRITNAENTLTSIIGTYYLSQNLFHFKDSVKIVNPDYVIKADTMDYNTKTEISFFIGPTRLTGDSLYLYCENGWYDTKNDIASISDNALIDNKKQIITGDSLYFDNKMGLGQSYGNVVIKDSTNNVLVKGNYAWYRKEPEKFIVTDRAVFIQVSKGDSLFLHADTLNSSTITDASGKNYRLMKAYNKCRIFGNDFQSVCDSLSYSFQDSVMRLYTIPVIWANENQLTADSMALFTKNKQAERLELYSSAFIASKIDSIRYNQIKGRSLTGYFRNNEIYKINISGNGESVYYVLDGEKVAGIDQAKCSDIEVLLENGKISAIYQNNNPDGFTDPPEKTKPKEIRLKGFNWYESRRPKKKSDIFID
jgi:lipopolysaccharide export system protein LptA